METFNFNLPVTTGARRPKKADLTDAQQEELQRRLNQEQKKADEQIRETIFTLRDFIKKLHKEEGEEGKEADEFRKEFWQKPLWYLDNQTEEVIHLALNDLNNQLKEKHKKLVKRTDTYIPSKVDLELAKRFVPLYENELRYLTHNLPFLELRNLLNGFIDQYQLSFSEYVRLYIKQFRKDPEVVQRNEDARLFFISLLPALRSQNFFVVIDEFNKKIEEQGPQSDLYQQILNDVDDIWVMGKLVNTYLNQFYNPSTVEPLEKVYEKFKVEISNRNRRQVLPPTSQITTTEVVQKFRPVMNAQLQSILKEEVLEQIKEVGVRDLSKELRNISDSALYSVNSDFVKEVIENIASQSTNVEDFAKRLGSLIVYLHNSITDIGNEVFIKRIEQEYYRPDILANLSPEEKLPEVYLNPFFTVETKQRVSETFDKLQNLFVKQFAEFIYKVRNLGTRITIPEERVYLTFEEDIQRKACNNYNITLVEGPFKENNIRDAPLGSLVSYNEDGAIFCFRFDLLDGYIRETLYKKQIPLNPYTLNPFDEKFIKSYGEQYYRLKNLMKQGCINFEDTKNIPDENIVTYRENEDVYCFDAKDIIDKSEAGIKIINKYTGFELPKEFVEKVKRDFLFRVKQQEELAIIEEEKDLAPGLIEFIINDIQGLGPSMYLPTTELGQQEELPEYTYEPFTVVLFKQISKSEYKTDFCTFLTNALRKFEPQYNLDFCRNEIIFNKSLRRLIYYYSFPVIERNILLPLESGNDVNEVIRENYNHKDLIKAYVMKRISKAKFVEELNKSILCETDDIANCASIGRVEYLILKTIIDTFADASSYKISLHLFEKPSFKNYINARDKLHQFIRQGAPETQINKAHNEAGELYGSLSNSLRKLNKKIKKETENSLNIVIVFDSDEFKYINGSSFIGEDIPDIIPLAPLKEYEVINFEAEQKAQKELEDIEKDLKKAEVEEKIEEVAKANEEKLEEMKAKWETQDNDNNASEAIESELNEIAYEPVEETAENNEPEEGSGVKENNTEEVEGEAGSKLCQKCKQPCDQPLKTMYINKDKNEPKSKVVYFCSFKCFEDCDISRIKKHSM